MIRNAPRISLLPALALLGSCAATPEQVAARKAENARQVAEALKGRVAAETSECIPLSRLKGPRVVGNDTVIYRDGGRRAWVSKIDNCPSLDPRATLIVEVHGSQLCRNDLFRTLDSAQSIPSGYCRFGEFTAYEKARDAAP